jgi:hypothetical protein
VRHGENHNRFDVREAGLPVDSLDQVLNVAGEVLAENGAAPGDTRIERMARFIAFNLGGRPYGALRSGRFDVSEVLAVWQTGGLIGFDGTATVEPDTARAAMVALLRAAELAEAVEQVAVNAVDPDDLDD